MLVDRDLGCGLVVPFQPDLVAFERWGDDPDGIIDQIRQRDDFDEAGDFGVVLLGGDDFLDVSDVAGEQFEFAEHDLAFVGEMAAEFHQVGGNALALGIGSEEGGQVGGVGIEHGGDLSEVHQPGFAHFVGNDGGRDVDAV